MTRRKHPRTGQGDEEGRVDEANQAGAPPLPENNFNHVLEPASGSLPIQTAMVAPEEGKSVGPPTADLKQRFSAQKIPLQTDFEDLINVADCGRKGLGLSPGQVLGTGVGLQLDQDDKLAVRPTAKGGLRASADGLAVVVEPDKGLQVDLLGVAVKPALGINVSGAGVGVTAKTGGGIRVDSAGLAVDMTRVLPIGIILMFSGSTIPAGWVLCDGANNTPDLRDRFVLGGTLAENGTEKSKVSGPPGGKKFDVTTTPVEPAITVNVDNFQLTEAHIPSHLHLGGIQMRGDFDITHYGRQGVSNTNTHMFATNAADGIFTGGANLAKTSPYGGGQAHKHGATGRQNSHSHTANIVPPYCILVFIMKVAE